MEIVTVTLDLRLDVEAIQGEADVLTWARILGIRVGSPEEVAWNEVYEELAKVIVGAEHYSRFSMTALSDMDKFAKMVRTHEIKVHHGEAPQVERPTLKVVPPPPPAPRKSPTKA